MDDLDLDALSPKEMLSLVVGLLTTSMRQTTQVLDKLENSERQTSHALDNMIRLQALYEKQYCEIKILREALEETLDRESLAEVYKRFNLKLKCALH